MNNLVVVMAGDRSLHGEYSAQRDFELWTIYYGDSDETFERYRSFSDRIWRKKGLKIELVRRILLEELHFREKTDFTAYDFVFLPDDDIRFPNGSADISRLFAICRDLQVDVFQPAISNEFVSERWEPTCLMPGAVCHRTNIVEIMMHGFSGRAFIEAYLPAIHAMQFIKSGWGIEPIWMKIGEAIFQRPLRTFVIDTVPAIHTRPIGSGSAKIHAIGLAEAHFVPLIEVNRIHTLASFTKMEDASVVTDEIIAPSAEIPLDIRSAVATHLILSFKRFTKSVAPQPLINIWKWAKKALRASIAATSTTSQGDNKLSSRG
jgi:hypothetical protein